MRCWLLFILSALLGAAEPSRHDLTGTGLDNNAGDSLPLGNGDVALHVWTEANDNLVVLFAQNDAWTENVPGSTGLAKQQVEPTRRRCPPGSGSVDGSALNTWVKNPR